MLFQITHIHNHETCPGAHPELTSSFGEWWNNVKSNPDIKVLGGYVSPMDHTFHITVEADDYGAVTRAMGHLNSIGTGHTVPVIQLDMAMPMAESGVFR